MYFVSSLPIKEHYFDLALFIHLQIDFIIFFFSAKSRRRYSNSHILSPTHTCIAFLILNTPS